MVLHVALRFGYDGRSFPSYARDPRAPGSVEASLIDALRQEGFVEGSFWSGSRTDAGVSAVANVCRVSLERSHERGLGEALRAHLPDGVWVTGVAAVEDGWNPRHARSRHYVYFHPRAGDVEGARSACARFVGTHDMRAFARLEEGRGPVRQVRRFTVEEADGLWRFDVEGPSFLWNQVRRMVGAVVAVARGQATLSDIDAALASGKVNPNFETAAAEGLVLWDVAHPDIAWQEPRPWRQLEHARVAATARHAAVLEIRRRLSGSA